MPTEEQKKGLGFVDEAKKNQEAIDKANADAIAQYNKDTEALSSAMSSSVAKINESNDALAKYYEGLAKQRDEANKAYEAESQAASKRDARIRLYGGLGEVAAHIANVIATSAGAAPAKWQSPQQEWAQRADSARREREAKSESYRKEYEALLGQATTAREKYNQGVAQGQLQTAKLTAERNEGASKMSVEGAKTSMAAGKEIQSAVAAEEAINQSRAKADTVTIDFTHTGKDGKSYGFTNIETGSIINIINKYGSAEDKKTLEGASADTIRTLIDKVLTKNPKALAEVQALHKSANSAKIPVKKSTTDLDSRLG